jgi:hypothetical protein
MGTTIEKYKEKRTERKEGRKKIIAVNKPLIIRCHALPHKKENTVELLRTQ